MLYSLSAAVLYNGFIVWEKTSANCLKIDFGRENCDFAVCHTY